MVDHTVVVDALYMARKNGTPASGLEGIQLGLEEALEIQLRVLDRFTAAGDRLGGWKVGLTSGTARDRMGKDFRPFGYVLHSRIFPSGAMVPATHIVNCAVEPELCLIIGSPLRGDAVDAQQAKAAVRAVAPAFEINQRRVPPDAGHALLVADGLAQWGVVVGPEAPVRDGLVHTAVTFYCDDQLLETQTPGTTMDDPYLSLARVCRLLHRYERGLEPGQPVITGAFYHHIVRRPGTYRAVFSDVGEVSVQCI